MIQLVEEGREPVTCPANPIQHLAVGGLDSLVVPQEKVDAGQHRRKLTSQIMTNAGEELIIQDVHEAPTNA
ncbi:Hypothetical protein CAP_3341 [Chondromyces apiculatus DSM 436]|uniref:Uncharacterized protein n=1 Tax=Chondromyces apiculatus DSM 436 TaxID=1192034 RepID=A0A017T858_9BACT|nr:Hypothetical protein CAP_3341 [Chondromyces apiculatus DSM 436]